MATIRRRVKIPLDVGEAEFVSFDNLDQKEHIALLFEGKGSTRRYPLVRVHSECLTGDVFGSGRCDCGEQLQEAIRYMQREGGILLYLRQEGRGIGLYNKLDSYALQLQGLDTYEANRRLGFNDDMRNYKVAAEMLTALGQSEITLLTNNPEKRAQLEQSGIHVAQTLATGVFLKESNREYLRAKVKQTRHWINLVV